MKNEATASFDQGAEIPLDLTPLLSALADGEDYTLRVEKLPDRGHLSNGRNNGDRTWSLKPDDLSGLTYLPPEGMNRPHTLEVRVVRLKNDTATTVALHEIPVAPPGEGDRLAAAIASGRMAADEDDAYEDDEIDYDVAEDDDADYATALSNQLNAGRSIGAKEIDGLLVEKGMGAFAQPTESELVLRLEQTLQEVQDKSATELADAVTRYETAETALAELAGQVETLRQEHAAVESARAALQTRLQESEAELVKLGRETERAIEAEAKAKASADAAETAARAKWDAELEDRLAEARQEAEGAFDERAKASADAAVTKARSEWDAELEDRLAEVAAEADRQREQACQEVREGAARKLAAAEARYEKAEEALRELGGQVEALQKAEVTYRKTQVEFSVLQNRTRTLEDDLNRAQEALKAADKNGSAEATEAALAEAREAWEIEQKDRLAEAAAAAARRLEAAEKAWQARAARELDEAKSRYEKAESSVEELQGRVEALRSSEVALQSAKSEIVELRVKQQRLDEARTEWERQSEGELAAAKQRYDTAEASVQMLTQRVEALKEAQAAQSRELESRRAAAQAGASGDEAAQPAKRAWLATAVRAVRAAAKWIHRRVFAPVGRFVWRHCFRSAKVALAAACIAGIAVGAGYYPSYAPAIQEAATPVIAQVKRDSLPTLISTAFWLARLTHEEPEVYAEFVTVKVEVANVREGPSTTTRTIAKVPRHTELVVIERRGNWVLVELTVEGVQTGWIYNTLLSEI